MGEQIAFAAASQAVEKGLSKLSPRNKEIVLSSIQGILGITLCLMAARQLYKVITSETVEVV